MGKHGGSTKYQLITLPCIKCRVGEKIECQKKNCPFIINIGSRFEEDGKNCMNDKSCSWYREYKCDCPALHKTKKIEFENHWKVIIQTETKSDMTSATARTVVKQSNEYIKRNKTGP